MGCPVGLCTVAGYCSGEIGTGMWMWMVGIFGVGWIVWIVWVIGIVLVMLIALISMTILGSCRCLSLLTIFMSMAITSQDKKWIQYPIPQSSQWHP